MKEKRNFGFTIIELLTVIVIIGIIMAISLPSVNQLVYNQDREELEYHKQLVEAAMDLYIDQYAENFPTTSDCFNVSYNTLIDENLLVEDKITCYNENEDAGGFIQITRFENNNNFTYELNLVCKRKGTDRIINDSGNVAPGCLGVNGDFYILEDRFTIEEVDSSGNIIEAYDHNWTGSSVKQTFQATDPYMVGLRGLKYSLDNGKSWNFVVGNTFTINHSVDIVMRVKAVDNDGNESSEFSYDLKIDKIKPNINTVGKNPSSWTPNSVTLTVNATDDDSGMAATNGYSFDNGATWQTANTKSFSTNQTVNIKVKDAMGNISDTKSVIIGNIDKTVPAKPTITNPSGGNWTNSSVTLTLTSTRGISGIYYQYSYDNSSWTTWSNSDMTTFTPPAFTAERNGTVYIRTCTNAGLCSEVATTTLKIDTTKPTCGTISGASTSWTSSDRTISVACTDSFGECAASSYSQKFTTTTQTANITIKDKAGNERSCPVNVYVDKTKYTITVTNTTGGTFTTSATSAMMGTNITVTATPATNYKLKTITAGGTDITSAKKFTMPRSNVVVTGTWEPTTITKYRTKTYTSKTCTSTYTEGNHTDCGGCISCNFTYSVCNKDGYFLHNGACSAAECASGWTLWCTETRFYDCTKQTTTDCSSWSEWSSWTTTACTASSTVQCESATCLSSSASGACTTP